MEDIRNLVTELREKGYYPTIRTITSGIDPEITIDGRRLLMFCSNDYLALANFPKVKSAAIAAIENYGVSTCASRLISGNTDLHEDLENELADFLGTESAIVFTTGYMANSGVIPALVNGINMFRLLKKETIIISEELNHASIIDGCKIAKNRVEVYKHSDTNDLEKKLKKFRSKRKIVITDAVFSMDGDYAPIKSIVGLCRSYNALLMVDEAHSIGVLGKTGRGVTEFFDLEPNEDIPVLMGTLSKAIGSIGGYIAGSKLLIDYLRVTARSYIFTASPLPPASTAAAIQAIREIKNNPKLVTSLNKNADYLRTGLKQHGFDTLNSSTPIIPIVIGDEVKAIKFSDRLFNEGILAPCVRWPAVPKGKARIRCVVMATHTKEHLDTFIEKCKKIKLNFGI